MLTPKVKDSNKALAKATAIQEKQKSDLAKLVNEGVSDSIGLARQRENILHVSRHCGWSSHASCLRQTCAFLQSKIGMPTKMHEFTGESSERMQKTHT